MRTLLIAWSPYNHRGDLLAQKLDAPGYFVHALKRGKLWQLPVRYVVQSVRTWRILRREQPAIIFVQNPPIICVLLVFLYCQLYGARYIIDAHTGALLSPQWRWSIPLHRFLSRRAITTIVTNQYLKQMVNGWGAHAIVIGYIPAEYPATEPFAMHGSFNVAVVSTFAPDEPLEVIFAAAARLPDVHFYVSGNPGRAPASLLQHRPGNVFLTGYIPNEQYLGMLRSAHAVLDLTTRDHTLLLGAFEAVALGTPLIISDWPILREYFSQGAIHVPNTVDGVCDGIRRMQRDQDNLRHEIVILQGRLRDEWRQRSSDLRGLLTA